MCERDRVRQVNPVGRHARPRCQLADVDSSLDWLSRVAAADRNDPKHDDAVSLFGHAAIPAEAGEKSLLSGLHSVDHHATEARSRMETNRSSSLRWTIWSSSNRFG